MDPKTLCLRLLQAEDETEVDAILKEIGYFDDDPTIWQPFGGYEMNFNLIGNQQADATAALVEKLINSIDAVLMSECFKRSINPEGPEAPASMAEAVKTFFGVREGRLENLSPEEQTALAENIHLVAVGSKSSPSYLIIDRGEGQTPATFPDTFLSLQHSNKMRIPFVQGQFNSGGTGILQFCGSRNYELIISRRQPHAPLKPGDTTKELWGFTLVRRMLPTSGKKASVYLYLAPNKEILSFASEVLPVLPGESKKNVPSPPYAAGLAYGTCIKLYNYRWKAKSTATLEARYELERYLHLPCLPFRITESRSGYKANKYNTTLAGVWVNAAQVADRDEEGEKIEKGFPADGEINLPGIGELPYRMILYPMSRGSGKKRFPHGVFFTRNGQVHGDLPANFIASAVKFDYLSGYLLVSVDCTKMNPQVREDFFMASRDRLRRNEVYDAIYNSLKDELRAHPGLREHNALRKQQDLEKALSDEKETVDFFQDLLKSDPTLAAVLGVGDKLVTTTGPAEATLYEGRKFPTFFHLSKEPKGGLVKYCPLNRTVNIEFDTDAENNYFTRADSPGSIVFNPLDLCVSSHLWNGKFRTRFAMPWDAEVGDEATVTVTVSDIERETRGNPFVSTFKLKGAPEAEDEPNPSGRRRNGNKRDPRGREMAPGLALPKMIDVRREEWDKPLLQFNEFSAIKIAHDDDEGGYIFYLNMDNTCLLTELTRVNDEEKSLIKYWFKYGLTLCAMGMLRDEKRRLNENHDDENGSEADEAENLDRISRYCTGLSRVIVPIIRLLHRGPQLSAAAAA